MSYDVPLIVTYNKHLRTPVVVSLLQPHKTVRSQSTKHGIFSTRFTSCSMDREYSPNDDAHPSRNRSPSSRTDCQDAKTTQDSGYRAHWRDDWQLEMNSLSTSSHERGRPLSARPKDNRVYQDDLRPLAIAKPRKSDEQHSSVPKKPSITFPLDEKLKSAKQTMDAPPVYETIHDLLTPLSKEDRVHSVVFELRWDIVGFLSEEVEGLRNLAPVLTLSGTTEQAFAATCEDYIRRFWSGFGLGVLEWLTLITQNLDHIGDVIPSPAKLEGIHLEIAGLGSHDGYSAVSLRANGKTECLIKLAQILTWIAATFRRPQYGKLSYSIPTFQRTDESCYSIGTSDLEPIKDGLCWCPMFSNGIIAKSFPTPERNGEIGLEISFDLMVMLGRIWYPMEYLNGFVLKGYSTILVPTLKTQHSVQWHFVNNEDQNKKINMSAINSCCGEFVEDIDLRALQTARTFVGWTWDARVHVGAKTSGYDSIRNSKVPYSPRRPRLAREMTSGIGTSGLGFFGVQLGTKIVIPKGVFGPVKREHILMEDMLLNSRTNPLLLWDAGTRRGWMVSEIAVLLMIIHVWAARQTDSETLLKKLPFAEITSDDAQGSYEAIRRNRDLQLRSQTNGDGEDLKFMTQVENIFAAIESRKEEIITRNNVSAKFGYSKYLKGWELIDIAHSKPWFKEKRVFLDDTCGTWPSVVGKQREVLVLFCKGVGDLIQPSQDESFCQTWRSVPKGHSYLAATVSCITNLDIHCRLANRFKSCSFNYKNCPSRLQELNLRPSSRSIPIPRTGAIIVGRLHHSLFQACSPGLGQPRNNLHKLCIEQDATQERREVVAVENSNTLSSIPQSKVNPKDICATPTDDNDVQIKGRARMGEEEINTC